MDMWKDITYVTKVISMSLNIMVVYFSNERLIYALKTVTFINNPLTSSTLFRKM